MILTNLISNIHWIPVIVMTFFSFALGSVWHQKFLFGKTWTEENKPTLDKKNEYSAHYWRNGCDALSGVGRAQCFGLQSGLAKRPPHRVTGKE